MKAESGLFLLLVSACQGFTTYRPQNGLLGVSSRQYVDKKHSVITPTPHCFSGGREMRSSTVLHMSAAQPLIQSMTGIMSLFSPSALQGASAQVVLESITSVLSTTPPSVFFLCLVVAGFGVPISEDALCIFAGTILPMLDASKSRRLLMALYTGVVFSDMITFTIGKTLRSGVLEPIRNRMNLRAERINFCEEDEMEELPIDLSEEMAEEMFEDEGEFCAIETPDLKKTDKILAKLEAAGDYVGFVIRFSVGIRTPMMMLAGFSGKVPFLKYFCGTTVGAAFSLTSQLLIGYLMRNNPTAIVAAIASISTIVLLLPISIALCSWTSMAWDRYQFNKMLDS